MSGTGQPDHKEEAPLHMDKSSRNERLRQHLLSLGLFVERVYRADSDLIDYLKVTTGLPGSL